MNNPIFILLIAYVAMSTIAVKANALELDTKSDACELRLEGDVSVSDDEIIVSDATGNQLVIKGQNTLIVEGRTVMLDKDGQHIVEEYAGQIRNTIPKIVAIALEGVEVGLTAVTEVFYTFSEDGPPASLLKSIENIREEITQNVHQDNDRVFMRGGELSGLEPAMQKLQPELEDAIADAVSDMIVSTGNALKEADGSFMERIAEITRRAQALERNIEQQLAPKVQALKQQAEGLCSEVYTLQAIESTLHATLPETRPFNLVKDG